MNRTFLLIAAIVLPLFTILSCAEEEQEVPVERVSINQPTAEMEIGETIQLSATVSPSNATHKEILWSSSKKSVASVTDAGLVTALAEGSTTIYATADGKRAECAITVSKGFVEVTSLSLNSEELQLVEGESKTLIATVKPDDATNKTVAWTTSDQDIATVDNGRITAIKEGEAIITAVAGKQSATCKVTVSKAYVEVSSISLNKIELPLIEGGTETLIATVKPDDATDKTVTWTTSHQDIATVDGGLVTAIKEGEATISAKAGDKTATCKVTVSKKVVSVESVTLNKTDLPLTEGDSEVLVATVKPDNATDKSVTWSSQSSAIADVDANGKVTAVAPGETIIFAKAGEKSAQCKVTVSAKKIDITMILLSESSLSMIIGEEKTLVPTIIPENATVQNVEWSSSNTSVATVLGGVVKAVKEGSAKIVAYADGKTAECSVTVDYIHVQSLSINKTELSLYEGENELLEATYSPQNATYPDITWTSKDESIATVNNGTVSAIKKGVTTITAKADGIETTCSITVLKDVEQIVLNSTGFIMNPGQVRYLNAQVLPKDADMDGDFVLSSSKEDIATVDQNGKITAVAEGITIISASVNGKKAECKVIVNNYVDLGLSVKWATTNLGATCIEDYGDYYAWGETAAKSYFTQEGYVFYYGDDQYVGYTKYVVKPGDYWPDYVDNKTVLEYNDDAARKNWDANWRIPKKEEWDELISKCNWVWTEQNGVPGYKVTATNGKSIFLPAGGFKDYDDFWLPGELAEYWSSSLFTGDVSWYAWIFKANNSSYTTSFRGRYGGRLIRPVFSPL